MQKKRRPRGDAQIWVPWTVLHLARVFVVEVREVRGAVHGHPPRGWQTRRLLLQEGRHEAKEEQSYVQANLRIFGNLSSTFIGPSVSDVLCCCCGLLSFCWVVLFVVLCFCCVFLCFYLFVVLFCVVLCFGFFCDGGPYERWSQGREKICVYRCLSFS